MRENQFHRNGYWFCGKKSSLIFWFRVLTELYIWLKISSIDSYLGIILIWFHNHLWLFWLCYDDEGVSTTNRTGLLKLKSDFQSSPYFTTYKIQWTYWKSITTNYAYLSYRHANPAQLCICRFFIYVTRLCAFIWRDFESTTELSEKYWLHSNAPISGVVVQRPNNLCSKRSTKN